MGSTGCYELLWVTRVARGIYGVVRFVTGYHGLLGMKDAQLVPARVTKRLNSSCSTRIRTVTSGLLLLLAASAHVRRITSALLVLLAAGATLTFAGLLADC